MSDDFWLVVAVITTVLGVAALGIRVFDAIFEWRERRRINRELQKIADELHMKIYLNGVIKRDVQ